MTSTQVTQTSSASGDHSGNDYAPNRTSTSVEATISLDYHHKAHINHESSIINPHCKLAIALGALLPYLTG